jgi:hypothetical protein
MSGTLTAAKMATFVIVAVEIFMTVSPLKDRIKNKSPCAPRCHDSGKSTGAKTIDHFSHPDFTVGFGISPNRRAETNQAFADYTAGREFHPALKHFFIV